MADVRAMLRAERAARAPPKQKATPRAAAPAPVPASKKRKAPEDEDEDSDETRKRARSAGANGIPTDFFDGQTAPSTEEPTEETAPSTPAEPKDNQTAAQPDIDEDEWAAFERDVATPPPQAISNVLDALNASNAISSKPLTAEELAAEAREEQNAQRSKRDAEIEDEKEEADQALAEEFEEMEALEERVKKLRERREGLRRASVVDKEASEAAVATELRAQLPATEEEAEEDDDEDEDEDDFMFRR